MKGTEGMPKEWRLEREKTIKIKEFQDKMAKKKKINALEVEVLGADSRILY